MKPKISIIVAVYNVEKYVEKCLKSLFDQTYKNLEIIIVDDCSTDNSKKIVKNLIKGRKDVIFISNKKNMGLSYSRNIALKKSSGDYIGYIDSDDYIEKDYFESLMNSILSNKADIAVCDIRIVYENSTMVHRTICGSNKNNKIDFINNGLASSSCNKLFKREIISKYEFSNGKINEDLAVILPSIINSKKVVYNSDVYYNYLQREKSIQNSGISEKRFDIFYGVKLTLERIKNNNNYKDYENAIVYQQLFMFLIYVLFEEKSFSKRIKWLKKFNKLIKPYDLKENPLVHEFITSLSSKQRIYYLTVLKLNFKGLYFLASIIISMFNIYRKITKKSVIENNITINKLVELAKKQNQLKPSKIKISVVIPNYNYEKFLLQRIYSILSQKIKIEELIILDDCSTDNSRKLIDKITENIKKYITVRKVYNEKNSGSAFKQWEKGFELAKGDYVWIAEADDYCKNNFLKNVIKPIIKDKEIVLSYVDTAFIDSNGSIFMRTIKPEIDILKTGHWNSNFITNGVEEIKNYAYLNCTVANVSSVLFKNEDYSLEFKEAGKYKQAGDWLFYINVMKRGKVSFCNKPINYYRVHGNNVTSVTKKQSHFNEIKKVHKEIENIFGFNNEQKNNIKDRYLFLKKVWNIEIE